MVDRVNLSRILLTALGLDRELQGSRGKESEGPEERVDRVILSRIAEELKEVEYREEIDREKTEVLREKIREGRYEVKEEKIVEGLEEFFL
ncbi:MAG: hypothetical protein GXN96_06615 [Aquificae bacterium]|nr:hypothetical protein [Aquificota bacterium]